MAQAQTLKRDRMHLRIDAKTKRKLERAAAYSDTTVSDFVLANALAAATRLIEAREKITLSERDWAVFHAALLDPPAPNKRLKTAARRYSERVGA